MPVTNLFLKRLSAGILFLYSVCIHWQTLASESSIKWFSPLDQSQIELPKSPLTQGGWLIGQTHPEAELEFNGQKVTVDAEGYFIIGIGRDESKARLEFKQGQGHKTIYLPVEEREYNIQRIDGLPERMVNPMGEEVLKRIRSEAAEVYAARQTFEPRKDFLAGFIWPAKGPKTGVYGSQRVLNGDPKRPHFGVDVAGPVGTEIYAPADGVVRLAHPDMYYSGGTMVIDHGHGLTSTFLHLSKLLVKAGAEVKQGQLVAEMGATGRATGSHLDWRLNWFNVRLDPETVVTGDPDNVHE